MSWLTVLVAEIRRAKWARQTCTVNRPEPDTDTNGFGLRPGAKFSERRPTTETIEAGAGWPGTARTLYAAESPCCGRLATRLAFQADAEVFWPHLTGSW